MLYKNTLIKIKKSFGRYISLFVIVMVGVGFFAGIQASAPDMVAVADEYYEDHNLMDFKIVSTLGLSDNDTNAIKSLKNVKAVFPTYSLDVLDQDKAIRVHAIEKTVNTINLIDGKMPTSDNECLADSKKYNIGDQIKITSHVSKKLQNEKFTVVGTVESVLYLAEDYGNTTIGDGKLASYIFIGRNNFIMDAYTEIYVVATGAKDTTAYSTEYDNATLPVNDELVKIKPERENARLQEIHNEANDKIRENQIKLNNEKAKNEKKLTDAKVELNDNAQKLNEGKVEIAKNETTLQKNIIKQNAEFKDAKAKIANGWDEINSALTNGIKKEELKESIDTLTAQETALNKGIETFNSSIAEAKRKIENGKSEIAENDKKLKEGYEEYYKNLEEFNTKIADAQRKIDKAKKDLDDIEKPQWHIFDRDAAIGYSQLKSGIDVISSVASVFPFFFILIVLLMTSNSMARMIAEERSELGTLTSLGYKNNSIISTYLFYVLSASGLGAAIGFLVGCSIIPPLIYSTFKYILPPLIIQYNLITFSLILVVTLTLMTLVTVYSCIKELKQEPSALMRPVPPKSGRTILFEKIGLIWKHLSFTWKVTIRNISRYKKRGIMTIVGVAGCTALLLVGFGLKDSMNGVAERQYGEIFRYSEMIILNEDTKTISGKLETLFAKEQIKEPLLIKQSAMKCESEDVFLIVPENEDVFYKYYNLKNKETGNILTLNDSGVVITQMLSQVLKAGKGDNITIKDADNNIYQLTVADVAENYISNYIYMNSALYSNVFAKSPSYNTIVSNHNADQKTLGSQLIKNESVLNVIFTSDVLQKAHESNNSLNSIIILIVVVASLLAFIVLYNLTSINISERTREIATLKVLGFTDGETNGYIYREAFILTLISIGVGLIFGIFLHRFVIGAIEVGYGSLFLKLIKWQSFIMASMLTIIFAIVMQIVTYYKLRTIDMIESLKSVE